MTKRQKVCRIALAALVLAVLVAAFFYGRQPKIPSQNGNNAIENIEYESISNAVTISIRCDTLLHHLDELDASVAALVPENGVLLSPTQFFCEEDESVFDLLLRVTKENDIPMEFAQTPLYGSAYVEGIGNLYEFDCGELSGWMYRVNGEFPNYGCSNYRLHEGDAVEWVYTCDLGADVGNIYNSWQNE